VSDARDAVQLPTPQVATPAAPPGADLGVAGISAFITPNDRFYRVDTALSVPQLTPSSWRLRVRGMVDKPFTVDYQQLLARPMVERDLTLACVSNPVGGRYAGTARFLGTPLAPLLQEAGLQPGADQLVSRSVDGFTAGTPLAAVLDGRDALLVVGMNGEPLPVDHGFPVRMVVPGLYGYVSATKWLVDLEVSTFAAFDAYWVERGWAQQAPVKVMARIDTPAKSVKAGTVPVGGVAWAMHRGIAKVEVRVDNGPWNEAQLGTVPSNDTWRQWVWPWPATPGRHRLWARATTLDGEVQTSKEADTVPDGATGWHHVDITVS